jgi:type III secretory pathway component EscU
MSQQTKLKLRIIAIIIVLLAVGMRLQFIIIPSLGGYTFWFVVSSFILLLIASR